MNKTKTREVISGSFRSSRENYRTTQIDFKFNSRLLKRIKRLIGKERKP